MLHGYVIVVGMNGALIYPQVPMNVLAIYYRYQCMF
jgi:hypothetical protein